MRWWAGALLLTLLGACAGANPPAAPVDVVAEALQAWSEADAESFFGVVGEEAIWFGQLISTPAGENALQLDWDTNTTRQARFHQVECMETDETDEATGGLVVECRGLFDDIRYDAFASEPTPFIGRYAVLSGRLVNAISFQADLPDWVPFFVGYLEANLGEEFAALCGTPVSSGRECAQFMIDHLEPAAQAWSEESSG